MIYKAHSFQAAFHKSKAKEKLAASGKRGGKTECGAIEGIIHQETKPNWKYNGIDPYLGVIIAPTTDMLRRLSMQKFLAYSKGMYSQHKQSTNEIFWHDGSMVIGISADKPERLEGLKASWIWIDEVFSIKEQVYLEAIARLSDSEGNLWLTGSLGVQYENPKNHWIHKKFKENPNSDMAIFEWATAQNPYFPKAQIEKMRNNLDPRTFRQMFELDWNTPSTGLVYSDFDKDNIGTNLYDVNKPVYCSVDWGWNHPTAILYFQYDSRKDTVYLIDEIVRTETKLEPLAQLMLAKPYRIHKYYCDPAGLQTREQIGKSNIEWFEENHGIKFSWKRSGVYAGILLVSGYILNAKGQRKFFVDEKCKHSIDGMKSYRNIIKNGEMTNEPLKENDDCADAMRYFFINHLDSIKDGSNMKSLNTWDVLKF